MRSQPLEHALAGLARHDKVYGIRGEGYRLGARPADESQPSQENNAMKPKDSFEKIETLLKDNEKWFAPIDVANETGSSRASTVIRLATLAKQKKIQATGARRSLRYAALGVARRRRRISLRRSRSRTSASRAAPRGRKACRAAARAQSTERRAEASFLIDDAGRVTVVSTEGTRVELTLPDTKRLAAFIKAHAAK
jgi:hypothetical protein